jgi:site-specific recombinase XerD
VRGYRADLQRFSHFVGGDAGVPNIAELDRELLRGYQRHLARARTGPKAARRPLAVSTRARRLVALRSFLRFAARAHKRDRALILLLLSTGARISEILRLDRSQWKPERLWVVGKGDRERVVQVTDKARAAVDDYLGARTDHSPALFISFQPASKNTSANRLTVAGAQYLCRQLATTWASRSSTPTNCATPSEPCCKKPWATPD